MMHQQLYGSEKEGDSRSVWRGHGDRRGAEDAQELSLPEQNVDPGQRQAGVASLQPKSGAVRN